MARRDNMVRGLVLGAGLMYLLDPQQGRRRRALVRDQLVHAWSDLDDMIDTAARDLRNRAQGMFAEARAALRPASVDDEVLTARVRSEIGRAVSHPHAIVVETEDRRVTLSGPVLADEVDDLISAVRSVRGVKEVVDRLEVHDEPGSVPGLQGPGREKAPRMDILQENWAPATRLLVGAGAATALAYAARLRGPLGPLARLAALTALARAATNLDLRRLSGIATERRGIDIRKSINVDAPVDEVYEFWRRFENFPLFMAHLREVRRIGEGLSHWVAEGPAGTTFEWDAITTEEIPGQLIAWKSVEGATVGNAGVVKFLPNEQGGTRIDVRMTYAPPAGALGHVVASLLGVDPKHAMDEDLVRFKSLIEDGRTSAHGRVVRREELEASAGPAAPPGPGASPGPARA
jgi:uncharacterized membrane protein